MTEIARDNVFANVVAEIAADMSPACGSREVISLDELIPANAVAPSGAAGLADGACEAACEMLQTLVQDATDVAVRCGAAGASGVKQEVSAIKTITKDLGEKFSAIEQTLKSLEERSITSPRISTTTFSRSAMPTAPSCPTSSEAFRARPVVQFEDSDDEYEGLEPRIVMSLQEDERCMSMHAYLPPDKRERLEDLFSQFKTSHDSQPPFHVGRMSRRREKFLCKGNFDAPLILYLE